MANLDITIRRKNGAGYDVLYPTTVISQVEGLQTALDAKIPLTQKGAANGVATLDSSGLIPASQLSQYIRGGIKLQGSMGAAANDTVGELLSVLESTVSNSNGAVTREELVGYAWIATQDFSLTLGTLPASTAYSINPGDEGDSTVPISLEAGDVLLVSNYSLVSTTHTWTLAVINNTYGVATTTAPGIVQLYQGTSLQDNDSGVITNASLAGLTGTTADTLALGNHNHDGTYLGLTATAAAATKWATSRTITLTGDVTGSVTGVDGTGNISITTTVGNDSHTHAFANLTSKPTTLSGYGITDAVAANAAITAGTATKITYDAKGLVTAGTTLSASDIPSLDAGKITSGTFGIARIPTGTTSTTVALGDHTHTFSQITSKPTTIAGYGITDAYTETEVDTLISNTISNRPEIYYNASANSDGDIVLDLDSDGAVA